MGRGEKKRTGKHRDRKADLGGTTKVDLGATRPTIHRSRRRAVKLPYAEGTGFLVPVRGGGFARGVIARSAPRGRILLGYFFGPRLRAAEEASFDDLRPENAALRIMFGDLGLMNGKWPIVATPIPHWNSAEWPMPDFARRDLLVPGVTRLVRYADADPSKVIEERRIVDDPKLGDDSLYGQGAVEIKLDVVLRLSSPQG